LTPWVVSKRSELVARVLAAVQGSVALISNSTAANAVLCANNGREDRFFPKVVVDQVDRHAVEDPDWHGDVHPQPHEVALARP
jgi:hypothetical protein